MPTFRKRYWSRLGTNRYAVVVVAVFAAIGIILLIIAHGASPYTSNEAENGTLCGGATVVTTGIGTSTASGNTYVKFNGPGCSSSTITATLASTSRSIKPDMFGINGEGYRNNGLSTAWQSPAFATAFANLHLGYLRVGGGTTANFWDWRTGSFFADGNSGSSITAGQPSNPPLPLLTTGSNRGLQPLLTGSNAVTAVFDVNMESDDYYNGAQHPGTATETQDMTDQIAMLQAAQAAGIPVKYVELGNEIYRSPLPGNYCIFGSVATGGTSCPNALQYSRNQPSDGNQYITQAALWATAIKAVFPSAEVGVVGLLDGNCPNGQYCINTTWMSGIVSYLQSHPSTPIDAITYHDYWDTSLAPNNAANAAAIIAFAQTNFTNVYGATFAGTGTLATLNKKAWLTEWDYNDNDNALADTWADGLGIAATALTQLEQNRVELSSVHAAISTDPTDPDHALVTNSAGTNISTTAMGVAISQVFGMARNATTATQLTFSSNPDMVGTTTPSLLGWQFSTTTTTKAVILNTDSAMHTVSLPSSLSGSMAATQTSGSFNTAGANLTTHTSTVNGTVTLPPYSITTLN